MVDFCTLRFYDAAQTEWKKFIPQPPQKNVFYLGFWPDIVHVELLCHQLRFISDFCANGSLWNHLIYTQ